MVDLISRQAAIAHAISGRTREFDGEKWIRVLEVRESLQTMPSAQPERKKGKWMGKPIAGYATVRCSVCNDVFLDNAGRWKYCPNCGAEMGEEK